MELFLPNTLLDLGATINAMNVDSMTLLQLKEIRPTPIVLELTDKSIAKPVGVLEDIVVTIASWEYLIDFIVISPKTTKPGHPIVLAQLCLATTDSVIRCRNREMTISNGSQIQTLTIFTPAQLAAEVPLWLENSDGEEDCVFPLLNLEQSRGLQEQSEENDLQKFLSDISCIGYLVSFSGNHHVFSSEFQETYHLVVFASFTIAALEENREVNAQPVEINVGKHCILVQI